MNCADTPIHTCPARRISSARYVKSGAASWPPLTLSHSTSTTPLNAAGSAGRRTSTRVAYGAVSASVSSKRPSSGVAAAS